MSLAYVGGLPDWCGEAANRQRLETWYAGFGEGGIPCPICDVRKQGSDLRRLAQHLAAGKQAVKVKPAPPAQRRSWSVTLLASPPAVVDGEALQELRIVHLQLTCSHCQNVQLFDAHAIGIAV